MSGRKRSVDAVDFFGEVEAIRAELAGIDKEAAELASARVSRDEAIARIDAALADCAAGWKLEAKANAFTLASPPVQPRRAIVPTAAHDVVDQVASFLAAIFGPQIREAMIAHLPADPGLSKAERAERLRVLAERRRELERREELLILEAEANGVTIDRRGDLSPDVYLATTLEA